MRTWTPNALDELLASYARTVHSVPPEQWRRRVALRIALYEELERRRIPHSLWSPAIRHAIDSAAAA